MRVGKLKESGGRMTEQEAINLIHCCMHINKDGILEARDMAIQSLEKQIPMKPDIEGDGYANGHLVYDTWICPNCETHYEIDYDDYDYCPKCGQAIDKSVMDWSDEE